MYVPEHIASDTNKQFWYRLCGEMKMVERKTNEAKWKAKKAKWKLWALDTISNDHWINIYWLQYWLSRYLLTRSEFGKIDFNCCKISCTDVIHWFSPMPHPPHSIFSIHSMILISFWFSLLLFFYFFFEHSNKPIDIVEFVSCISCCDDRNFVDILFSQYKSIQSKSNTFNHKSKKYQ